TRPVEISGRVSDPAGAPVAGAQLYVGYTAKPRELVGPSHRPDYGQRAVSRPDGQFQFRFAPSELDADYLAVSRPVIGAVADGFGFGWAGSGGPGGSADLTVKLAEDLPVEGRILDADHRPIAGAKVHVREVTAFPANVLTRFLQGNLDRRSASLKSCRMP